RQQLIDWQGKVGEMKQALRVGNSQLELRQAAVEEQARQIADGQARLSAEAALVETQRQQGVQKRDEMERHLNHTREWYRRGWRAAMRARASRGKPTWCRGRRAPRRPGRTRWANATPAAPC